MKIYASAPNEDRPNLKYFFLALDNLAKKGHKVIDIYKNEKFPLPEDVHFLVNKFKQSERAIKEADVVLIDVTYPGRRIGFEIARALDEKKVVVALYDERGNVGSKRVAPLVGNPSKYFIQRGYTKENIDEVIEKALEIAKEQLDTKFILIISPEIDKYLEWAGAERRMHKAQVVREAIETMMNKDKDYKEFLKSID